MNEIVEAFKGLIRNSTQINKLLTSYAKLRENVGANAYQMDRKLTEISKIANNLPDFNLKNSLINWLNEEKKEVEKAKEEFRFLLAEQIKTLFQQDNKVIKGQYPILRVGFYTINLNFEFGEVTLYFGPEIEKIKSKISLEPEAIYRSVKDFDEELRKTKFEPNEFYLELQKAYKNCIKISNKTYGEKILLVDVLNEYVILKQPPQFFVDPRKENFREFSRITLAYMLYLFRKSEISKSDVHLYVATFDATTDKKHSLWIPDNEEGEGTYYSYIAFEKAETAGDK
ncbi:MAG: hypothetical protein ABIL22_07690 [candidate division WOR-3 bacterium]